jgi:predicted amidophosphoribosyltransferase
MAERLPAPTADVITYVPPDDGRLLTRGHHPPERLAQALAKLWGIEAASLLVRRRGAARQAGLTRVERRANIRGAFAARGSVPASVVLVDDVYTTGATCSEAASALRRGGAERVDVVTFARTIR